MVCRVLTGAPKPRSPQSQRPPKTPLAVTNVPFVIAACVETCRHGQRWRGGGKYGTCCVGERQDGRRTQPKFSLQNQGKFCPRWYIMFLPKGRCCCSPHTQQESTSRCDCDKVGTEVRRHSGDPVTRPGCQHSSSAVFAANAVCSGVT